MMFPPEIIDLFIQNLVQQKAKLSPLLSVSRAFYYMARLSIFRDITLTYFIHHSTNKPCARLLSILRRDDSLVKGIQSITVRFHQEDDILFDYRPRAPWQTPSYFPGLNDPNLITVLELVSQAPVTTLNVIAWMGPFLDMKDLHPAIVQGLIAVRCNPCLRRLELRDFGYVPRVLVTGTQDDKVFSLRLLRVGIERCDDPFINLKPIFERQYPPFAALTTLNAQVLP